MRNGYISLLGDPAAAEALEYQGFRRSFYSPLNKKTQEQIDITRKELPREQRKKIASFCRYSLDELVPVMYD